MGRSVLAMTVVLAFLTLVQVSGDMITDASMGVTPTEEGVDLIQEDQSDEMDAEAAYEAAAAQVAAGQEPQVLVDGPVVKHVAMIQESHPVHLHAGTAHILPQQVLPASVQIVLNKERSRLTSNARLIHKLTGVLNSTTLALREKDEKLEAEHNKELQLEANVKSAKSAEEMVKGSLSSTMAALTKERQTSKDLRERQSASATHWEGTLRDMHRVMADERMMRMAAETNASQMEMQLVNLKQDEATKVTELAHSQETLHLKSSKVVTMTNALQQAYLNLASTRHKLEHEEKANKQMQRMSQQQMKESTMKFTKLEGERAQTQKDLHDRVQMDATALQGEKAKAQTAFETLQEENNKLKAKDQKYEGELVQMQKHLRDVEKVAAGFHDRMVTLKSADEQLKQSMYKEHMEAERVLTLERQIVPLSKRNLLLEKTNQEQVGALQRALRKLVQEGKSIDEARTALQKTFGKLQTETRNKLLSDTRVRKLYNSLKQKEEQLKKEKAERIQLERVDAAKDHKLEQYAGQDKEMLILRAKASKLGAANAEVKALHAQVADAAKVRAQLQVERKKLAMTTASEKDLVDQLAEAAKFDHDDKARAEASEKELKKQLQRKRKAEALLKATHAKLVAVEAKEAEHKKDFVTLATHPKDYFANRDLQAKLAASEAREMKLQIMLAASEDADNANSEFKAGEVTEAGGEEKELVKILNSTSLEQRVLLKVASGNEHALMLSLELRESELKASKAKLQFQDKQMEMVADSVENHQLKHSAAIAEQVETINLLNTTVMEQRRMLKTVAAEQKMLTASVEKRAKDLDTKNKELAKLRPKSGPTDHTHPIRFNTLKQKDAIIKTLKSTVAFGNQQVTVEKALLKEAKKEEDMLQASLEGRDKELMNKNEDMHRLRVERGQLDQKLRKVSQALVAQHKENVQLRR